MATTAAFLTEEMAMVAAAQPAGGRSEAVEHQVCELLMQLYRQKLCAEQSVCRVCGVCSTSS